MFLCVLRVKEDEAAADQTQKDVCLNNVIIIIVFTCRCIVTYYFTWPLVKKKTWNIQTSWMLSEGTADSGGYFLYCNIKNKLWGLWCFFFFFFFSSAGIRKWDGVWAAVWKVRNTSGLNSWFRTEFWRKDSFSGFCV